MKKFLLGLALMLMAGAGSLYALGSFEGQVDYKMTTRKGENVDMSYLLKGKRIRINTSMKGHDGAMIMDLSTRKMMMLMPEQKKYTETEIRNPKGKSGKPEGKISKTGKTEVILGRKCEEWLYEGKTGQSSIWAVSGMGNFMAMGGRPGDSSNAWAEAVKSKGLFPLRMTYTDKSGNTEMTMEATKIDEKSLDAALFEVPAGYEKIEMPGFGDMGGSSGKKMSKEDIMKMMEQYKK